MIKITIQFSILFFACLALFCGAATFSNPLNTPPAGADPFVLKHLAVNTNGLNFSWEPASTSYETGSGAINHSFESGTNLIPIGGMDQGFVRLEVAETKKPSPVGTTYAYWTDAGGDHLWTTPANWQDGSIPGKSAAVHIRKSDLGLFGQGPVIAAGMDISIQSLSIDPGDSHLVLTMTGGHLLCSANDGVNAGNDGIRLGDGAVGSGTAEFDMTGGRITTYDRIRIGQAQIGRFLLSGTAKVFAPSLLMAFSGGFLEVGNNAEFHLVRDEDLPLNPVMPGGDPHAVLFGETLYMYTTSTSGSGKRLYAYSTKDLVNWRVHGPILDFNNIAWLSGLGKFAWAPCIAEKDGIYYFYYSAGSKPSHIGVATGSSPTGPFTDSGAPLLSDNNDPGFEAIDPMVFHDLASGKWYLYAGGSGGATLRIFELDASMLSFVQEQSSFGTPSNFTEGAFMHYRNGTYYISYSSGAWYNDTYSVHYSSSPTPYGPWRYQGSILSSDGANPGNKGPGHHSFVYNAVKDEWYVVYHRWDKRSPGGPYSGERDVAIDKLFYDGAGTMLPIVMTRVGVDPVTLGE